MNLLDETKYLMKNYHISADKSLGQNFLINKNVVNSIIAGSDINKSDLVIEIGPGLGTLTSKLLESAGKVICIELDKRMMDILNSRFSIYDNFELINNDVLKVDLNNLIKTNLNKEIKNAKVVANLPYYITTPIIMKLLEDKLNLKSITVMVQKEVALRLTEAPGGKNSGTITYTINYYTNPELVLDVPSRCFLPAPKIDSAVIKLEILKEPKIKVCDEKLFFDLIKYAFLQKRKTLINCLMNGNFFKSKEEAQKMLLDLKLDPKIRGERLSLEDYARITDYIKNTSPNK